MLGQSWAKEALGVEAEHHDRTLLGEKGGICSVVQEFLRNDARFSRKDVASYINVALQNEATDLWQGRIESLEVIGAWRRHVEQGTGGFEDIGAAEAERSLTVMRAEDSAYYNRARTDFGEAVLMARRSGEVSLSPETHKCVTRLDHDGHLTGTMGVDVEAVFGATPDFATSTASPETTSPHPLVDFSREIDTSSGEPAGGGSSSPSHEAGNLPLVVRQSSGGSASPPDEHAAPPRARRMRRRHDSEQDSDLIELVVPELEPA